ncbi:MAG: NAD(P)/FAD-dependent oxidoreductase [Methanospirillum sp.]|nr:NAD(P)/FAD-dependent oxidoreductase [Methanospirillum sp.]
MHIAIIGGGLTGIAAGYKLSPDHQVTVYEKTEDIGGLLSYYRWNGYSVERFYHHFFSGDDTLLSLLYELHLADNVVWLKGSTGTFKDGRIYPLTTPGEILRYPYLSLYEKTRLALFTLRAKKYGLSSLDAISAEEFIIRHLGREIYDTFFQPLLRSKFGLNAGKVSAAWLVSRVAIRSDRGASGERLGYLKGGFSILLKGLSRAITARGGDIRLRTPLCQLARDGSSWRVNGEIYDQVIATIAPEGLREAGVDTGELPYQGAACLTLALRRQVTNGIYWINMYDDAPYGAVIGHTCLVPEEWYGEHLVYLASYFTGDPASNLQELMIHDFSRKFSVHPDEIIRAEMSCSRYAGPLYLTGYREMMDKVHVPCLFMAGMFSPENYPERSIEGSIRAGFRVAEELVRSCGNGAVL